MRLRNRLLRLYGWEIGPGTYIAGQRFADGIVHIGADCYINRDVYFEGEGLITIGNRVGVGQGSTLLTVSHVMGPHERRVGEFAIRPVTIDDGCWISGANVTILPGVHIGAGAVVAAGAVVTGDVPPDGLVAGVPAVLKRILDPPG